MLKLFNFINYVLVHFIVSAVCLQKESAYTLLIGWYIWLIVLSFSVVSRFGCTDKLLVSGILLHSVTICFKLLKLDCGMNKMATFLNVQYICIVLNFYFVTVSIIIIIYLFFGDLSRWPWWITILFPLFMNVLWWKMTLTI